MLAYTNVSGMTSHLLNGVLGLEARFRLVATGTRQRMASGNAC
jgi:hypothetical protein